MDDPKDEEVVVEFARGSSMTRIRFVVSWRRTFVKENYVNGIARFFAHRRCIQLNQGGGCFQKSLGSSHTVRDSGIGYAFGV